ncbi:AAA family ATPase [Bifidobacterium ramosum]|nr:AAA family ATPase [Bifidobacterium ramosum]
MRNEIKSSSNYLIKGSDGWRDDHSNLFSALKAYAEFLDRNSQTGVSMLNGEGDSPRNVIYFGAPGTGKSYRLNQVLQENFTGRYERVTFYADYLHSQFVGSYKPVTVSRKDANGTILRQVEYQFRPGPFTRVLIHALNDPSNPHALVIEELNRSEAASVFGDVFQLLDRNDGGQSEYAITISEDLREYLRQTALNDPHSAENAEAKDFNPNLLTDKGRVVLQSLTGIGDCSRIVIPSNMYILATMNSADQGVFSLDTAFKRRWDFEYVGINDGVNAVDRKTGEPVIKDRDWGARYRKTINDNLLKTGIPEDKQMGPFFLGNNGIAFGSQAFDKAMKNKVIMYLFEDAAKYHLTEIFDISSIKQAIGPDTFTEEGKDLSLQKLFDAWDTINYGIFQGLERVDKPHDDKKGINTDLGTDQPEEPASTSKKVSGNQDAQDTGE